MSELSSEYTVPQPGYTEVMERAIADWEGQRTDAVRLPVEERTVGSLALLITHRLVKAGLIETARRTEEM